MRTEKKTYKEKTAEEYISSHSLVILIQKLYHENRVMRYDTDMIYCLQHLLIVLRFNDTSTPVGHFVSSPREREKKR